MGNGTSRQLRPFSCRNVLVSRLTGLRLIIRAAFAEMCQRFQSGDS